MAEQAHDLVGAECWWQRSQRPAGPGRRKRPPTSQADRRWTRFVEWLDLFAIYRVIRLGGGLREDRRPGTCCLASFRTAVGNRPLKGWLAASLTDLNGTEPLPSSSSTSKTDPSPRATRPSLIHPAQMASAAVERARLHQEHG